MIRTSVVLASMLPGLLVAPAFGQWVEFADETGSRIDATQDPNSGPSVIVSNPDEKDYAWGDVDQDGDIDLVGVYKQIGTTTGKRRNVLLMNEGIADGHAFNGVLVDRTTQYATASSVTLPPELGGGISQGFLDLTNDRDVILVDVNGDTWLDIVTATTLSGIPAGTNGGKSISHPRIYINLQDDPPGSGIWQGFIFDDEDRIPTQPTEPRFCAVAAGDVDGDSDLDLYFGDYEQGGSRPVDLDNRLFINNGFGYFSDESEARMTYDQREVSFSMAV
ncbi:MAG: hypothetical protein O7B26_00675, partial [Planctomycetota bacterium]|nr:hypothetical protein [Planctomycetota bacterium]